MINYTFLNDKQKAIVNHTDGPVMVLAGAGSGKTRVLTYRIAKILDEQKAKPHQVLALTFTNKAADEMRNRLQGLNLDVFNMWVSTFHSLASKILRHEAKFLNGFTSNFSIYDEQDKKNVIKKILKNFEIDDKDLIEKINSAISQIKNNALSFEQYKSFNLANKDADIIVKVAIEYKNVMQSSNAMDFDDLLINLLNLLKENQLVREKYQNLFKYILIDEFQDTNSTQYEIVKILGLKNKNIFAVGDEDQSIYSWRGACVGNIKKFLNDFGGTLYKLEQNYRSTKTIIDKANLIIKNNINRIEKTLFTENSNGTEVRYVNNKTDIYEADFVLKEIYNLTHNCNYNYNDIAVLMRINALSRIFEERLTDYNMPYRVFGGLKFYERLEIKNMLAYLKLIINPFDDESLLRIVNYPKRGIGDGALANLKNSFPTTPLLSGILSIDENSDNSLLKFLPFKQIYLDLKNKYEQGSINELVGYLVERIGLNNYYSKDDEEDINRLHNIMELQSSIEQYEQRNPKNRLDDYLHSVSLITDIDNYNEQENAITLATVHSVKGLEFKVVFIIGVEEGIFPIIRQDSNPDDMEEERRLMYVAITRSKERLYISNACSRYMYGKPAFCRESRFIEEMKFENKKTEQKSPMFTERYKANNITNSVNDFLTKSKTSNQNSNFEIGSKVFHLKFGIGTILETDNEIKTAKIDFEGFGVKILSLQYAPLKLLK